MQTIKLKYKCDEQYTSLITDYQRQYSNTLHVFYNKLYDEYKTNGKIQSAVKYICSDSILNKLFDNLNHVKLVNYWFKQSAIREAVQLINQNKNNSIVFGGKQNLKRRSKGLISREDFLQNKKLNPLYSIGDAPHKGNRFFQIQDSCKTILFKPTNNIHIELKLNIQHRLPLLKKLYNLQELSSLPISYKLDSEYIYISFDEVNLNEQLKYSVVKNRVLGIDMNPNYIGVTIIDWVNSNSYKVVKHIVYSIKNLNDIEKELKQRKLKSESKERIHLTNKRHHEIIQIVKNIISNAINYKCELIAFESLSIPHKNNKKGKKFNKLVNNNWCRSLFVNNLTKRCNILGIKYQEVCPEYSSFIGNFLFRTLQLPDMCLAAFEISRRGYEFYNQYIIKTKNKQKNIIFPNLDGLENLYIKSLEEFNISDDSLSLKDIYYKLKKSKTMYRLSINKLNIQFSRFLSKHSYIMFA